MKNDSYTSRNRRTDPSQCNGCGVCMLSCPVWNQHHTKALTYCGRNRASIGGAAMKTSLHRPGPASSAGPASRSAPWASARSRPRSPCASVLRHAGSFRNRSLDSGKQKSETPGTPRILLPGKALRADATLASSVLKLLGQQVGLHSDDGYDIALALESGQAIKRCPHQGIHAAPDEGDARSSLLTGFCSICCVPFFHHRSRSVPWDRRCSRIRRCAPA